MYTVTIQCMKDNSFGPVTNHRRPSLYYCIYKLLLTTKCPEKHVCICFNLRGVSYVHLTAR